MNSAQVIVSLIAIVCVLDIAVLLGGIYSGIQQREIKRLKKEKMRLEIDSLNLDIVKKYNIDMRKAIKHTGKIDGKYYCPYCGRMVVFTQETQEAGE